MTTQNMDEVLVTCTDEHVILDVTSGVNLMLDLTPAEAREVARELLNLAKEVEAQ